MTMPGDRAKPQAARERDLDRLLARLARAPRWSPQAGKPRADGAILALAPQGSADASLRPVEVAPAVLRRAHRAQLLERSGDGALALSDLGRARLARKAGGEDGYRRQHQTWAEARHAESDGTDRTLTVNTSESPLAWLRTRKGRDGKPLLDAAQFEAGERLRADVTFGRIGPDLARPSWQGLMTGGAGRGTGPGGGLADLTDAGIAARVRVERALAAVGPELAGILIDVCCELRGLEHCEKARGWPPRTGKVVLALALTRLARHYGLDGPAR